MTAIQDVPLNRLDGAADNLGAHKGKVLLVVNVASKCGLTPQYEGLEKLFESKRAQGLEVLGFPANNFGAQEPGSNEEIADFCSTNYGVQFPMFSKISVVGADKHPLYVELTKAQPTATGDGPMRERLAKHGMTPNPAPEIVWNFEKFVVSKKGDVVARFSPDTAPDNAELLAVIDAELAK